MGKILDEFKNENSDSKRHMKLICDLCNEPYVATELDMRTTTTGTRKVCLCPDCEDDKAWKIETTNPKGDVIIDYYPEYYLIMPQESAIEVGKPAHLQKFGSEFEGNDLIGVNFFVGANKIKVSTMNKIDIYKLRERIF
jgi:hypothetical protein